jgi:hypothetical protein
MSLLRLRYLVLSLLAAGACQASMLFLEPVVEVHLYQQQTNSPCIIGENSCQQGTFPAPTLLEPNADSFDVFSPTYTVAFLEGIVGNSFFVGLDVNQTSVAQQLSTFQMLVNGQVVDTYNVPNTPVPQTVGGGNGTGYADYLLTGFTPLSAFNDTDSVSFRAVMPLVNDGREQFFLISDGGGVPPAEIPEPGTWALLASGVLFIAAGRKKLFRK